MAITNTSMILIRVQGTLSNFDASTYEIHARMPHLNEAEDIKIHITV